MKLLAFIFAAQAAFAAEEFRLKTPPEGLSIFTPDGEKSIIFDTPTGERPKSFRVQIPISELRPAPTQEVLATSVVVEPGREPSAAIPPEAADKAEAVIVYDDTDSILLRANYLFNRGDYFGATLKVDELLKKNPKLTRGWVMKGTLFYVQGFKDLAKSAWEKAYELSNQDPTVKELLEKHK